MKSVVLFLAAGLCLALPVAAQDTQTPPPAPAAAATATPHVLVRPVDLKWGDAPPVQQRMLGKRGLNCLDSMEIAIFACQRLA